MISSKVKYFLPIAFLLLLLNPAPILAQEESGEALGSITESAAVDIPLVFKPVKPGLIIPMVSQPVGGGQAIATVGLEWGALWTEGQSKSELSASVSGSFFMCAQVVDIRRNNISQGSSTNNCGSNQTGGDKKESAKWLPTSPSGATWWVKSGHTFTGGSFNWLPNVTVTHTL
jgi:hypothetical protein